MKVSQPRKGARSIAEIQPEVLALLNVGELETANLMEWLAVDQRRLLETFLQQNKREKYAKFILPKLDELPKPTAGKKCELIAKELLLLTQTDKDEELFLLLANHKADSVRGWAAFMVGLNEELSLANSSYEIKVFANDHHFGVRELAWLSMRQRLIDNLKESIEILAEWSKDKLEGSRRFASEITRPRGVWCKHINELKENPALALSVLEPLKNDPAKYVRDSVGNWLNDAAKNNPEWVLALCKKWQQESDSQETAYILKKAKRNL